MNLFMFQSRALAQSSHEHCLNNKLYTMKEDILDS